MMASSLLVCAVRVNLARGTPRRHGTHQAVPHTLVRRHGAKEVHRDVREKLLPWSERRLGRDITIGPAPLNILCGRSCSCSHLPRCCGFFLWSGRWGNSCVARVRFWMSRVDVENFEAFLVLSPPSLVRLPVGFREPRDRPTGHHVHGLHSPPPGHGMSTPAANPQGSSRLRAVEILRSTLEGDSWSLGAWP